MNCLAFCNLAGIANLLFPPSTVVLVLVLHKRNLITPRFNYSEIALSRTKYLLLVDLHVFSQYLVFCGWLILIVLTAFSLTVDLHFLMEFVVILAAGSDHYLLRRIL